ncbi:MAG: FecR domain-containing protein [Firmicutes bacterium]|nr:FecR domain-containing protein [Bacillota bacterium]
MKKILALILSAIMVVSLNVGVYAAETARVITVYRVDGRNTFLYRANTSRSTTPRTNARINSGDTLVTGAITSIYLNLDNDSIIKMDSNSEIQFEESNRNVLLNLKNGNALIRVEEQPQDTEITVLFNNIPLTIRGTLFTVGQFDENIFYVAMLSGSGEVDGVPLDAGQILTAWYDEDVNLVNATGETVHSWRTLDDKNLSINSIILPELDQFTLREILGNSDYLLENSDFITAELIPQVPPLLEDLPSNDESRSGRYRDAQNRWQIAQQNRRNEQNGQNGQNNQPNNDSPNYILPTLPPTFVPPTNTPNPTLPPNPTEPPITTEPPTTEPPTTTPPTTTPPTTEPPTTEPPPTNPPPTPDPPRPLPPSPPDPPIGTLPPVEPVEPPLSADGCFVLTEVAHLIWINGDLERSAFDYCLGDDILIPNGSDFNGFVWDMSGNFEGNNYAIRNFVSQYSLFYSLAGGSIRNLTVYGEIHATNPNWPLVGGIADYLVDGGIIENVHFVGNVSYNPTSEPVYISWVGGIVGLVGANQANLGVTYPNNIVRNVSFTGNLSNTNLHHGTETGGIVGGALAVTTQIPQTQRTRLQTPRASEGYVQLHISNATFVGNITNNVADSSVYASNLGGIFGSDTLHVAEVTIENVLSVGNLAIVYETFWAENRVGGIAATALGNTSANPAAGVSPSDLFIRDSVAINPAITGGTSRRIGNDLATENISNVFAHENTALNPAPTLDATLDGTATNAAQLMDKNFWENTLNFDFANIWQWNADTTQWALPTLQNTPNSVAVPLLPPNFTTVSDNFNFDWFYWEIPPDLDESDELDETAETEEPQEGAEDEFWDLDLDDLLTLTPEVDVDGEIIIAMPEFPTAEIDDNNVEDLEDSEDLENSEEVDNDIPPLEDEFEHINLDDLLTLTPQIPVISETEETNEIENIEEIDENVDDGIALEEETNLDVEEENLQGSENEPDKIKPNDESEENQEEVENLLE